MTEDPRFVQGVPYAAAAWNATGGPQSAPASPAMPQQTAAATGGQQQSGAVEVRPPAVTPNVDAIESDDEVVVLVDAPGFDEEHITVHADESNLYVTADRSDDPIADTDEGERVLLRERPTRLERAIALPGHIDPHEATAEHDNGVCRITIPKNEEDRQHEIAFQ